MVDAEGQPRVECAVVALGADDRAIALTWTNSAGIARLPSKDMNVDLVIDAGSRLHREPNVLLSSVRHRVEILAGVEISGRAMLDDRPANPGDGLEIELSRTEEPPEPFKTAQKTMGVWWLPKARVTATIDENGEFHVRGFDVGWKGSASLIDTTGSRRAISTVRVAAPSSNLVVRGHRPPPAPRLDDDR